MYGIHFPEEVEDDLTSVQESSTRSSRNIMKMLALGVKDHQLSVLHVQLTQDKFKSKQSPSLPTAESSTIYVVTMADNSPGKS